MRSMPRHLSFDAWNTLIQPNPEYSKARNAFLAAEFGISTEKAGAMYTHIKRMADKMSEEFGHQYSNTHLYEILAKVGLTTSGYVVKARDLRTELFSLFRKHPPIVPDGLAEELATIKERGNTISILSNTNFIPGEVLCETVFDNLAEFDFVMFSDEYSVAKPHGDYFEMMIMQARKAQDHNPNTVVIHIGDSEICDVKGALQAGIKAYQVESPRLTVQLLKDLNGA